MPPEATVPANLANSDGGATAKVEKAEKTPGAVLKQGEAPPAMTRKAKGEVCVVRITKTGHGQVHDGEGGTYDWNTEVALPLDVATALESRSLGEIIA